MPVEQGGRTKNLANRIIKYFRIVIVGDWISPPAQVLFLAVFDFGAHTNRHVLRVQVYLRFTLLAGVMFGVVGSEQRYASRSWLDAICP